MSYHIHLSQFEGPLSLLLYLIRKEEMDILDINVGEITKQYLNYIRMMKELDLEVAGEFVQMAATLIHIKSRILLPTYDEEGEEIEGEDPRKELVQKLLEFQKFQEAAKKLYERPLLGRELWKRGRRETVERLQSDVVVEEDNALFALISCYRRAITRASSRIHTVKVPIQSIASRIREIREWLKLGVKTSLFDLAKIGDEEPRRRMLITFLSILELAKMGLVRVFQNETYGDIWTEAQRDINDDILNNVEEYESVTRENPAAEHDQVLDIPESDEFDGLQVESVTAASGAKVAEPEPELATDEEIERAEREIEVSQ